MYKYNLKVVILSDDKMIEDTIRSVKPLEHYEHTIISGVDTTSEECSNADVLIIDEGETRLSYLMLGNKIKVMVCAKEFKKEFEHLASVIPKPINYDYLKYEFIKLLHLVALEDDKQFTQNCLDTAINSATDMFWVKSLDGIHELLNDSFCKVVGKTKEDVTGKDHYYIWDVSPDDPNSGADKCKETEDAVIEAHQTLSFNEAVKCQTGSRQLVTYKSPLTDKKGEVLGTVGWGHDITDLNNLGMELQILLDSMPYAILLKDVDGIVVNVNTFFEEYFGTSKKEIIGTPYEEWAKQKFVQRDIINSVGHKEGIFYHKGEEKHAELRFENILDAFYNVTGQVCIFGDITLERKLRSQLTEQSNTDFLSGLYNRRYLREYISNIQNGTVLTLFAMDLDHFKDINDTYGHDKGDEVIKLTSKLLRNYFNTDLVVRMGGDEFLVVKIGSFDNDRLRVIAQSLIDYLSGNFRKDEKLAKLSASIGIAQGVLEQNAFSSILSKSDKALYEVKQNGRGSYVIYEDEPEEQLKLRKQP